MGLSPAVVRAMSLWDFMACADGCRRANDPKAEQELSDAEADDLARFLDETE